MKLSHLGFALLISCIVYLIGALIASPYGPTSYRRLEAHVERLESNVRDLRRLQKELIARAELYRRNADAVAVEARRLQYYEPGEEVIRISESSRLSSSISPGAIVRTPPREADRRAPLRIATIATFVIAMGVQIAFSRPPARSSHRIRRASR